MVGILMLVGASEASILSISIIYGLILIITALPGAYFWTTSKKITSTELNNLEETLSKDENNES
jgi:flagellar basal body-associated protein FliL